MVKLSDSLIKKIKELGESENNKNQNEAFEIMLKKITPYNFPMELLPTVINFLKSDDLLLQQYGGKYTKIVTLMKDGVEKDEKYFTQKLVEANAIQPLSDRICAATSANILVPCLETFCNIAFYARETSLKSVLPNIIKCLNSQNEEVSYSAAMVITNVCAVVENISLLNEVNGFQALIKMLESKSRRLRREAMDAIFTTISHGLQFFQLAFKNDAVKVIHLFKKISDDLFDSQKRKVSLTSKKARKAYKSKVEDEKEMKKIIANFVEKLSSFGVEEIDILINAGFVDFILKQLKIGAISDEIKIKMVKSIRNIFQYKISFIPTLINEDIIPLIFNLLEIKSNELILLGLYAINDLIRLHENKSIKQKFIECNAKNKIECFLQHENDEIKQISLLIFEFADDGIPVRNDGSQRVAEESPAIYHEADEELYGNVQGDTVPTAEMDEILNEDNQLNLRHSSTVHECDLKLEPGNEGFDEETEEEQQAEIKQEPGYPDYEDIEEFPEVKIEPETIQLNEEERLIDASNVETDDHGNHGSELEREVKQESVA
uniref:Uncharacterized protein n=1 Tax=Panagrolaimus davidi TaxID=227884 RepID=A0A914PJY4_9BILA